MSSVSQAVYTAFSLRHFFLAFALYADAGQMHMYLNYARENWTYPDENPPVGLILCNKKNEAVAHYALEGLSNILAAEYQTALPEAKLLAAELERTRKAIENRLTDGTDLFDEPI